MSRRRLLIIAVAVISIIYLIAISGMVAIVAMASNISQAKYLGTVTITNNSTLASGVSANFSLNTAAEITTGIFNSSLTNTAIRDNLGNDVPYMPGYGGNPWIAFVSSIGPSTSLDYALYAGGALSMASPIRYFPDATGMTINQAANMEPSSNATISVTSYIDTSASAVGSFVLNKSNAFSANISGSGNITAGILPVTRSSYLVLTPSGAGSTTNITSVNPAEAHYLAVSDNSNASYVYLSSSEFSKDLYTANASLASNIGLSQTITGVTVYGTFKGTEANCAAYGTVSLGGSNTDGAIWIMGDTSGAFVQHSWALTRPGGGSWSFSDIQTLQIGVALREVPASTVYCGEVWAVITYTYTNPSVTASGLSSGSYTATANLTALNTSWATGNVLSFAGTGYARDAISNWRSGDSSGSIVITFKSALRDYQSLLCSADEAGANDYFQLMIWNDGHIVGGTTIGGVFNYVKGSSSVIDGNWHQVIFTGSGAAWAMYLDGSAQTLSVLSGNNTGKWLADVPNRDNVVFGARVYGSPTVFYLTGSVSYAQYYNTVLSGASITSLYAGNMNVAPTNLQGIWYFDTGSGTTLYDYSGNYYNATITNGTWATSTYTSGSTGRPCDFTLQLNSNRWGTNLKNASVPVNTNNWQIGSSGATPYMGDGTNMFSYTQNGTVTCNIPGWSYAATFPDTSGHGNTGIPSFRTTSSNANVSAILSNFAPIRQAVASQGAVSGNSSILPTTPPMPSQMYATTGNVTWLFLGPLFDRVLDSVGMNHAAFWFPVSFLIIYFSGYLAMKFTKSITMKAIVVGAMLFFMVLSNIYGFWVIIFYFCEAFGIIVMARSYGW